MDTWKLVSAELVGKTSFISSDTLFVLLGGGGVRRESNSMGRKSKESDETRLLFQKTGAN